LLSLLGVIFAAQFIRFLAPGFPAEKAALTIQLTQIMYPFILLVSLAALVMGMLNATVGAGMISFGLRRAANIHRQSLLVNRQAREALNGHKSAVLWFTGLSGSGKSTLLMVMAGLEQAERGQVLVDGADFTKMDEDALAQFRGRHIGIVFQSFHLIPTMTALENVAVPLELAGYADPFARAREELMAVGLSHRLDHFPAELSGGEQQRVALARAMAPHPALLFADEPTGNLDEANGNAVIELLFHLKRERGTTLVLVTHDAALAARCDRTIRLRSGQVEA
jgi:putative ABC transport system ATP-binding protein